MFRLKSAFSLATKDDVLNAVKKDGLVLEHVHGSRRKDKDIVLEAVRQNGQALRFAHDLWKKDKDVVLQAMKQDWSAIQYADDSLTSNKQFVLEAVKYSSHSLQYADDSLRKDKEIALEAVKRNMAAFANLDNSLKRDRQFMLDAVKLNGFAFQYADGSLKSDKRFVLEAVQQNRDALQHVDDSLKNNKQFLLEASAVQSTTNSFASHAQQTPQSSNHIHDDKQITSTNQPQQTPTSRSLKAKSEPNSRNVLDDHPIITDKEWSDVTQMLQSASFVQRFQSYEVELNVWLSDQKNQAILTNQQRDMMNDPAIRDYFITFQLCLEEVMIACKAVHSQWVSLGYSNKKDYVIDGIDLLFDHVPFQVPGVGALVTVLRQVNNYPKKQAVNNMSSFCIHLHEWSQYVKEIALIASEFRRTNLPNKSKSKFDRVKQAGSALIDVMTANNINTPLRKLASEDADNICQAIMTNKLSHHSPLHSLTLNDPRLMHVIIQDSMVAMTNGIYIPRSLQSPVNNMPPPIPPRPSSGKPQAAHALTSRHHTVTTSSIQTKPVSQEEFDSLKKEIHQLKSLLKNKQQNDNSVDAGNQLIAVATSNADQRGSVGIQKTKQIERQLASLENVMFDLTAQFDCWTERQRRMDGDEMSANGRPSNSRPPTDYREEFFDSASDFR